MDKIERIMDMTEHPEKYSEEELRDLLVDDEEGRKIYRTICELHVAMDAGKAESPRRSIKISFIRKMAAIFVGACLLSGIAYAVVATGLFGTSSQTGQAVPADSVRLEERKAIVDRQAKSEKRNIELVKTYEDVTLDKILSDMAQAYGVGIRYKSQKAMSLRLYFSLDTHRGMERNVEELNSFENIDITIHGDTLFVE